MIEKSKVICDGCGKDITNDFDSFYIRKKRSPYKVFSMWWGTRRSLITGKIKRPIVYSETSCHTDLCHECFQNVCKYMEAKHVPEEQ